MEDYLPKQKEKKERFLPKQKEALLALSKQGTEKVLYGGGKGGGKSELGCRWQIERRLKYPGTRSVVGRASFSDLQTTTMHTMFMLLGEGLPHSEGYHMIAGKHYNYNGQKHVLSFCNGSEIIFKDLSYYPHDPNYSTLGSLQITDYFVDEATEINAKCSQILHTLCRYRRAEYGLPIRGLYTCNPEKGWLYNEVYMPNKMGSLSKQWTFIPALPDDNPTLPQDYLDALDAMDEYDRQRLRYGNWEYDDDRASLFKTDDLHRCFREEVSEGAERYISADVARFGKDRTVIAVWKGLACVYLKVLRRADTQEVVREIRALMAEHNVKLSHVIADEDGVGGGICDALRCRGFINGAAAKQKDRYTNQKAECYYKLASFIEQGKVVLPHAHRNDIIRELEMIRRHRPDADGKLSVTPKDQLPFSPDIADSLMMRMHWEIRGTGYFAVG